MAAIPQTKKLNLAIQEMHLKHIFPNSVTRIINKHSELEWDGELTPSHFSQSYSIQMNYRIGKRPKVQVVAPELDVPQKCTEIHMFGDHSLCLHLSQEWRADMLLEKTIIPWTSEWLLHYELWKITGKWHGGGLHPEIKVSDLEEEKY